MTSIRSIPQSRQGLSLSGVHCGLVAVLDRLFLRFTRPESSSPLRKRLHRSAPSRDIRCLPIGIRQELTRFQHNTLLALFCAPPAVLDLFLHLQQYGEYVLQFRLQQGSRDQKRTAAGQESKGIKIQIERPQLGVIVFPVRIPGSQAVRLISPNLRTT